MKPCSNRRTRRNTTFVAMLTWAFALASGMANACLLVTQGKHAHIAAAHPSAHRPHAHAHDAVAGDAMAGVELTDPGLAPFVVFACTATTPVASVPSWFDELQVPVVGPPFRLRYSRLTL